MSHTRADSAPKARSSSTSSTRCARTIGSGTPKRFLRFSAPSTTLVDGRRQLRGEGTMLSSLKRAPAVAVACVAVLALAGAAGATFNTSRLLSAGTNGADTGVAFEGVSADGSKVFFTTTDAIAG